MHKRIMALLFVASILLVSGCISGSTIKRQAAEPADNTTNVSLAYYEDNAPEAAACDCPDSFRTCGDGFNTTCENSCTNDTCSRCVPDCAGHNQCNETWFCGEWQPCSGSVQTRRCIDSSFCNKTAVIETRSCPDSCSTDVDCPAGSGCSAYICRGSPKACERVVVVPCCGDGVCDTSESCQQDCPSQQAQCNQTQCPSCLPCNETAQQNQSSQTNLTHAWHVVITEIMYYPNVSGQYLGEFVEIMNDGNTSVDISGWVVVDNNKANNLTASSYTLAAMQRAVIVTENTTVQPASGTLVLSTGAGKIGNGLSDSDAITIAYPNGTAIDFKSYDNPGCAKGYSLVLLENKSWACGNVFNGTPGY